MQFKIKKGLDLPITGAPEQKIYDGPLIESVAVLGKELIGLKPTMLVQEGEPVSLGQPIFRDKRQPRVQYTAPGYGVVSAIHRGEKRVFQSVVITLDHEREKAARHEEPFPSYYRDTLSIIGEGQIRKNLLASGLWTAFRTRPYSKAPSPDLRPHAIFVTAMDSNPLSVEADVVLHAYAGDFRDGLAILSQLTENKVFVCRRPRSDASESSGLWNIGRNDGDNGKLVVAEFAGPHPAGLPGTHIHFIDPVSAQKTVWHIGYQDVIAIGKLFTGGNLWVERIVSLAGPMVRKPRLIRTRLGANIQDLIAGEIEPGEARAVSGSVLSGHKAAGWSGYLGRYHTQVSVLSEERERHFLDWIHPGINRHSHHNVFVSSVLRRKKKFPLTTSTHGGLRAMVPVGSFSRVLPLDILPTILLRSLIVGDTDKAQQMGCLELDEEDLALCSYVCPSKYEYGPALRAALTHIEREG
uniref:Na(+)-translocating NADH-quinone reductase subunit A n=1 Tax=Candidatus Kentrum sp. UNK TaxID=2126344 RepID=A0A451ABL2_9GAMM|nr:MAG: Na+-transporting NADH:ubiquinone oxidoreductase subunit A [Candidatus Kentron sp. UNK]VFK72354.1 MAG: Na+-transporting NADH:ubiquinone oxidoreductase subunit A [Candidatus Kentron sp. UNK]